MNLLEARYYGVCAGSVPQLSANDHENDAPRKELYIPEDLRHLQLVYPDMELQLVTKQQWAQRATRKRVETDMVIDQLEMLWETLLAMHQSASFGY